MLTIPALALLLTGIIGYGYCAWEFAVRGLGAPAPLAPPKNLVVSGLYRRTRNPMFQNVLLILLAEALLFPGPALAWYAGMVALILHLLVVLYEEPRLRARFGSAYIDYCGQVPRWGAALHPSRPNIK
ncbi:methyltransferase family protein [Methylomagnum sp.]